MKIYGASLSPFVRKTLLVLESKGIPYEQVPVVPLDTPAGYEKIHPLKKIPAMEHDGFTVPDSSVICAYLEEVFPEVSLLPGDPRQRATARFIEEYGDTRLVESIGPFFFERLVKPMIMQQPPDEARLGEIAANQLPEALAYVDGIVPDEGFLFGGDRPGIADFAIASPLINGRYGGVEVDAGTFPRLAAYFSRVCSAPVVANRLEIERREMAAMQRGN